MKMNLPDENELMRIYLMRIHFKFQRYDEDNLMFQMCAVAIMMGCHKLQRYDANLSKLSSMDTNRWKKSRSGSSEIDSTDFAFSYIDLDGPSG